MPRGVLSDRYAVPAEPDEPSKENSLFPTNEFLDEDYFSKEERPAPKLHRNLTHPQGGGSNVLVVVPEVVVGATTTTLTGQRGQDIGYRKDGTEKVSFLFNYKHSKSC